MGGDREEVGSSREEFKGPLFCRDTGRASGGAAEPAMEKVRAEHSTARIRRCWPRSEVRGQ